MHSSIIRTHLSASCAFIYHTYASIGIMCIHLSYVRIYRHHVHSSIIRTHLSASYAFIYHTYASIGIIWKTTTEQGYTSLRFNFPYRAKGNSVPSRFDVLEASAQTAALFLQSSYDVNEIVFVGVYVSVWFIVHVRLCVYNVLYSLF